MSPLVAYYYLTYKCTSRCTYCDIPTKLENLPIRETDPELIIENLAALRRMGVKAVDFTGGEPLIYPHLPRLLRAAKDMGFFTSLANSGTLYLNKAKDLRGLVDNLMFSLSTTDPVTYKSERGIDAYDKVIESIKLAKRLGDQPSILATATPKSIWGLEKVVRLAQELDVIVLLGPVFDYISVNNSLLNKEGIEELKRLATMDHACVNWAFLEFYVNGGNQREKPRCRAISSVVVISPDDHLLLPCYHMHDERLKIKHESNRSNLDELWKSAHVQERRKQEGTWSFCKGCTVWPYFDMSFMWPPDKYFFLNMRTRGRWVRQRAKQWMQSQYGQYLTRKYSEFPGKDLVGIGSGPIPDDPKAAAKSSSVQTTRM